MYTRTQNPSDTTGKNTVIWCLGLAMAAALCASPVRATGFDGAGLKVFGLTKDQQLVKFRSDRPRQLQNIGPIAGLNSADTALVGIDFRVQDGKLYGLGNGGGIYTIDTGTGVASEAPESPLTVPLDPAASFFGVDFNPAANALRILSDRVTDPNLGGQNLSHSFVTRVTTPQTNLTYPPVPPSTSPTPGLGVTGAAYTNNDLDATTGTTLFDIDSQRNQVVIQSPPGSGVLVPTGSLTGGRRHAGGVRHLFHAEERCDLQQYRLRFARGRGQIALLLGEALDRHGVPNRRVPGAHGGHRGRTQAVIPQAVIPQAVIS
jgi:Domain of unknown function (DUF4394)